MEIIIHGKERDKKKLKGNTITEFAKNMQSEGWPAELTPAEADRIKYAERRNGHVLTWDEGLKIQINLGLKPRHLRAAEIAKKQGLTHYREGYPGVAKQNKEAKRRKTCKIFYNK